MSSQHSLQMEKEGRRAKKRFKDGATLALLMEEETTSQGMWAVSRCWKRQGNGLSSWSLQKGHNPSNTLILA